MIAKLLKVDHSFSRDGEAAPAAEKTDRMQMPFLRRASRGKILFFLVVVLPTILAILYYGLIASNVYVSNLNSSSAVPTSRPLPVSG